MFASKPVFFDGCNPVVLVSVWINTQIFSNTAWEIFLERGELSALLIPAPFFTILLAGSRVNGGWSNHLILSLILQEVFVLIYVFPPKNIVPTYKILC
jgi:hypothetical protein